jgi:hypothetical protein
LASSSNHKSLPEEVEAFRDRSWRRAAEFRVESAVEAEQLIEAAGFCFALTDSRRPGPSLYIACCGRRDAFMPRNVQKDPESSLAWVTKDEVMRRGKAYYAKLIKGHSTFIARRLVPYFNALWGVPRKKEASTLSVDARAILKVLRREWEMATRDLRADSGISDRARFTRALDELQRTMKVIPAEVIYQPTFSYIWMLSEGRFPEELNARLNRETALREIARAFLQGAGATIRGELARITGLSRVDAGKGNHALVAEGYADRIQDGVYRLSDFNPDGF